MDSDSGSAALEAALRYHDLGWAPIPLHPGDKRPLIRWNTPERLPRESLSQFFSGDVNVGVRTGKVSGGLVVLDVDGPEGRASLERYDLPTAPMAFTGGGGEHHFFTSPNGTTNSAGKLGRGLDVRGEGGYVVVDPSTHPNGQPYAWVAPPWNAPPPEAPKWLVATNGTASTDSTFDRDRAFAGVGEGERDNNLFKYACSLRARNVGEAEATVLVKAAAARCTPPFSEKEAMRKLEQAWRYEPGDRDAKVVQERNGETLLPFRTLAEVVADIPEEPEWVVPGFIAPETETLLVGPPKVGKSTLLFRLLAGLEDGGSVLGLPVRKVSYLLLSEESPFTLQEKMFDFDLRGRGGEALLYHESQGHTWIEVIQESVQRCKEQGHELLVVDTFSRWAGMGGESENSAGGVQSAWSPLTLAKEAGLATTVLHHTRKAGGKHGEGIRGSNAIAALPDILLELSRTGGEDETGRMLNAESRYRSTPNAMGLVYTGSDYEVTKDVSSLLPPRKGGVSPRQVEVLDLLGGGPMSRLDLAGQMGISTNAVKPHLDKLIDAGKVFHTGIGSGSSPYLYHLAA
jgi:biotin operon repressor